MVSITLLIRRISRTERSSNVDLANLGFRGEESSAELASWEEPEGKVEADNDAEMGDAVGGETEGGEVEEEEEEEEEEEKGDDE